MDIISHANVLPWQIDGGFVLQLAQQAALALVLLVFVGTGYAALHRLLSNRTRPLVHMRTTRRRGWPLIPNTVLKQEMGDEA